MGLRGPGAGRLRAAKEAAEAAPQRRPAWERKGLSRVERVIRFLESLPITKGKLAGKKMRLLPGQRRFVERIYGPAGKHRIRLAVKSEPRGNGKTGLLAGLALCHLLGPEAEQRGEVYSAAIDRQQAGIMFAEMEAVILRVPSFAARVNIQRFHKRIEVLSGVGEGSTYEALSADARRAHGLAPSLWVYDELAQAKDRELLDNLMTAMGKRKAALGIVISTQAPDDAHPLSQLIDDGEADPSTVVDVTSAAPESDPFAIETIRSVNPALGVFLDEGDLRSEAERARRRPEWEPAFRNLRLNQRVDAETDERLVNRVTWKLGDVAVDAEALRGRRCFGGLDLSRKHDLTAFVLVFPDDEPDPGYDILPIFWTPRGQLDNRPTGERELFDQWIRAGLLNAVDGPVIRFKWAAAEIVRLSRIYDIRTVAYDPWRIEEFQQDLEECGGELPMEEFVQGTKSMGPAIDYFVELALTGRLRHGGHRVLADSVSSAVLTPADTAGNMKIDKSKNKRRISRRIDGAVALVMALGTARRFVEEAPAMSVFELMAQRQREAAA